MASYITLGGKHLLDPGPLIAQARTQGTPIDMAGRANSYTCPRGQEPGQAWVLIAREDLDSLDGDAWHELKWIEDKTTTTIKKLAIVKSYTVVRALPGAKNAARLVLLEDKRRVLKLSAVDAQYNVRQPAPSATSGVGLYYADSLNGGAIWGWQEMLTDLWGELPTGLNGTAPTLPYSPDGTPEGWRFVGVSVWGAIHEVLEKLDCTTAYNPIADTMAYVRLVDTQTGLAAARTRHESLRNFDYDPGQEYNLARAPERVRVYFPRRELYHGVEKDTPAASNWEMAAALRKNYTTGLPGAEAGTVLVIWDDLPALYDSSGSNTNSAALQTRADELGSNIANRYLVGDVRSKIVYNGVVGDILPGSEVAITTWQDYGDGAGTQTVVTNRPQSELGEWGEVGLSPMLPGQRHSEHLQTVDFARHSYPVYPRVSQTVQADDGVTATGGDLTANGSGLYPGYVHRWAGGAWSQLDACWIRPADLEGASEAAIATIKQKDRFHGRLSGVETYSGDSRPVYLVRIGSPGDPQKVLWGVATSNWEDNGATCDSVDVNPCDDCDGTNPDGGTTHTVFLPKSAEQDPNVISGETIGYQLASDSTYCCSSDYLDDKIGTVKMWALAAGVIPPGWGQCDGSENSVVNGGSGIDLQDRFVRAALTSGGSGGTENHTHAVTIDILPHTTEELRISLDHSHDATIEPHTVAELRHDHEIGTGSSFLEGTGISRDKTGFCTGWPQEQGASEADCSGNSWGPLQHFVDIEPAYGGGTLPSQELYHQYNTPIVSDEEHLPQYIEMIFIERLNNAA